MGSLYKPDERLTTVESEMIDQCQRLIEKTKTQSYLSERDREDFIRVLEARIRTIRRSKERGMVDNAAD